MNRRSRAQQGGFTIIELLVTMVVTMIGLAAMFGVFKATGNASLSNREYAEALAQADESLEQLQSSSVAELEAISPYQAITYSGWGPVDYHEGAVVGATGVTYARTVEARALDDDLVWFRVAVSWISAGESEEDPSASHQIAIETVRSRGETQPR